MKAGQYAYRDRRKKKTVFRSQWQMHINAAVRPLGMTYSTFIHAMRKANVILDRKVLSELAEQEPEVFAKVVEKLKG